MAVEYVCEKCGSANVTSDAVAKWNTEKQHWVIVGHYDSSECLDCADESDLIEREIMLLPASA